MEHKEDLGNEERGVAEATTVVDEATNVDLDKLITVNKENLKDIENSYFTDIALNVIDTSKHLLMSATTVQNIYTSSLDYYNDPKNIENKKIMMGMFKTYNDCGEEIKKIRESLSPYISYDLEEKQIGTNIVTIPNFYKPNANGELKKIKPKSGKDLIPIDNDDLIIKIAGIQSDIINTSETISILSTNALTTLSLDLKLEKELNNELNEVAGAHEAYSRLNDVIGETDEK